MSNLREQAEEEKRVNALRRVGMWAVVEVLGHGRHVGRVYRDDSVLGASTPVLRVETPAFVREGEASRYVTDSAGDSRYMRVHLRESFEPTVVYLGAASIFRIRPVDEAAAMAELRAMHNELPNGTETITPIEDEDIPV